MLTFVGNNQVFAIILILWASAIISAFLDNIPFVATLIPMLLTMEHGGMDVTPLWWALSLGVCLGGNGSLIGASANVVLAGVSAKNGYPITLYELLENRIPYHDFNHSDQYSLSAYPICIEQSTICNTIQHGINYGGSS